MQSSTIALMIEKSELPPVDAAIFADTGWESESVYEQVEFIKKTVSFPVYTVQYSNLKDDLILAHTEKTGFVSIPFFTANGGMGKRQCTADYKITPVNKKMRELLGYKPKQRIPENSVDLTIGISFDELSRMKPNRNKWIKNHYPLVDLRMTRWHCLEWLKKYGFPEFKKSSCVGCPYHDDRHWSDMKETAPAEFEQAIKIDAIIRNGSKKMLNKQFMHRSLKPLPDVNFTDSRKHTDMFINECEGFCGV